MGEPQSSRPDDIPEDAWRKTSMGAFDALHMAVHRFAHALIDTVRPEKARKALWDFHDDSAHPAEAPAQEER